MKKLLKSFLTASLVTIIIHVVGIIILLILDSYNYDDLIYILPISISSLIFPSFLSMLFFDKSKSLFINIFIPSVFNFVLIYIIAFTFFKTVEDKSISFLDTGVFSLSFISSVIAVFITLTQKIKANSKFIVNVNLKDLKYSYFKIFLIPISGCFIYFIIMTFDHFDWSDTVQLFYRFLPIGFIFSLISIHFFNYLFIKYNQTKRNIYIIFYYIISISIIVFWIIISYNNFVIVKDGLGAALAKFFLFPSILLYTPFFFYVLIVTHFYFLSLISKQEKQILHQQSLESQLNYQQLKNQISPHFLFNNINVLTSLIEENPKKAVLFSENLSHIYRYFLEQEKQDVVLVKNEIEFAKSYLELLKDRFESGLNFTISVDEKSKEKYIVSTILQQVLENVVKHNEISSNKIINVKISSEENYLVIENNKNLKQNTTSESKKGIENMKQRIAFFTDKKVIIEDVATHYIIKLPTLETV